MVMLSENIDTTTAAGKMVFRMLEVLSEFERDLVSELTTAALSHKRANGYKTGGITPSGFDVDGGGRLIKNPREQLAIAFLCQLRNQGHSFRRIAEELDARGVKSKTGKKWGERALKYVIDRAA